MKSSAVVWQLEIFSSRSRIPTGDSNQLEDMKSLIDQESYIPHFSGHETFPLRQLWLKKAFDSREDGLVVPKSIFNEDHAIARFGVGKNMVASLRHWALACGVIVEKSEDKQFFHIDPLWASILDEDGFDAYCENTATTWLAHWRLCGVTKEKHRSTTWWWLFNKVLAASFTKEDLVAQILEYCEARSIRVAEATIKRDVETCVRCYAPKDDGTTEDSVESMLGEIGILREEARGTFSFNRGPNLSLPNGILDLAICEYWESIQAESTLSFDLIAHGPGSPGRVFKIDENSLAERLSRIGERTSGKIFWTDTAGVRQIQKSSGLDNQLDPAKYRELLGVAYA